MLAQANCRELPLAAESVDLLSVFSFPVTSFVKTAVARMAKNSQVGKGIVAVVSVFMVHYKLFSAATFGTRTALNQLVIDTIVGIPTVLVISVEFSRLPPDMFSGVLISKSLSLRFFSDGKVHPHQVIVDGSLSAIEMYSKFLLCLKFIKIQLAKFLSVYLNGVHMASGIILS